MQPKFTKLFWLLCAVAITPSFAEAGLKPASNQTEVVKQNQISGRVVDQDGNPVAGASISNLTN